MNSLIKPNELSLLDYIVSHSVSSQRNETSRISLYERWLQDNDMHLVLNFNLVAYRDYLMSKQRQADGLSQLSHSSAAAHLNSIRARYLYMLDKAPSKLRDLLYAQTPSDATPADKKAYVDEMLIRIRERVQDQRVNVRVTKIKDEADHRFVRLSYDEMLVLCERPLATHHNNAITGIRDSAILTVLCMTGIREEELVNLDVADIHQSLNRHPALEVRQGKGAKQRIVPYGTFHAYFMERVHAWQQSAQIQSGALFRALTKWGTVRKSRISKRAINYIVGSYPIETNGKIAIMRPHDCRRTYARLMRYEFNMPLDAIAKNMGHENTETTQRYIGAIDISSRIPQRDSQS